MRKVAQPTQVQLDDSTWINLGGLRELVRKCDELGLPDSSLVSQSVGRGVHPHLRHMACSTYLIVEGP